jgi:hypothetical protein
MAKRKDGATPSPSMTIARFVAPESNKHRVRAFD